MFQIRETPVKCSAEDAVGNSASKSFTVTVNPHLQVITPNLNQEPPNNASSLGN